MFLDPQERGSSPSDLRHAAFDPAARGWMLRESPRGRHRSPLPKPDRPHSNWYHGERCASRSEVACAALLERYVPGFKIERGKTYEVPILDYRSQTIKTFDFCIDGTFIEFHPPRFWRSGRRFGDFAQRQDYFHYRRELAALPNKDQREAYETEVRAALTQNYYEERLAVLRAHPRHAQAALIVAAGPEQFYERVICVFGENYPPKAEFVRQFRAIMTDRPKR